MASLELRNKTYRVVFMHAGRKHGFSLDTGHKPTAEALRGGVEKTLMLIAQGAIPLPDGADIVAFVRAGGKSPDAVTPAALTIGELRDRYLAAHHSGAMEESSLRTLEVHFRHLVGTFGQDQAVARLALADLQRHVDRRLASTHRGKPVGPATAKKDVTTLRSAWGWAAARGLLPPPPPAKGLVYPKADEKPPFLTLGELERKLAAGGLTADRRAALCESLYLRRAEVDELLEHARTHAAHQWVYPMVCAAAHTGARRSELLRMEVGDLDLAGGVLLVREKKRSKRQRTTRHVALTPLLAAVLRDWLAVHPGGRWLFCQAGTVARSKTRGRSTGHRSGAGRATTTAGRRATVRRREVGGPAPVTKDEAHDHLKRTLAGSRWGLVRGWHVFRHSYISCLAAAGVDQRLIDEFVGHCTDEQRRRYRHLIPDLKAAAVAAAFG